MKEADAKRILYAVLTKYIPQESIDQAWQEVKEAGIFSVGGCDGMNYQQALERARAAPRDPDAP